MRLPPGPLVPAIRRGEEDCMGGLSGYRIRALARLLLALLTLGIALLSHVPLARADVARYGADLARVQAAVTGAGWPERQATWCGIAASAAIVNYRLNSPL